jgi:hypothetical protein
MIADKNPAVLGAAIASSSKEKERIAQSNLRDESLPTLPLTPTLVPVLQFRGNANANSDVCPVNPGMRIVREALEAIPMGSAVAFATDDLGALFSAGTAMYRDTESYRVVEQLAQACNCVVGLHEETGTMAFLRQEQ